MEMRKYWPVLAVLLVSLLLLGWRLNNSDWRVRQLAEIGTQFSEGDPQGTEGYDGQFVLYMAETLNPAEVEPMLDVPAYRYQRILLPASAWLISAGQSSLAAWAILLINLLVHLLGVGAVCRLLEGHGKWSGYALLYGLWAGLLIGVGAMLHEPLAYGLVALAWWQRRQERDVLAILLVGLSMFAKETTIPFLLAFVAADLLAGKARKTGPAYAGVLVLYAAWQVWLLHTFGQPGIGSGGANATSFELIPFAGLLRIARVDLAVFGLYLLLFGPGIVLPAVWGAVRGLSDLWQDKRGLGSWALLLNAGVIMVLPFSTFREPLGLIRLASGLVLSIIAYAAIHELRRPLIYGWFWLAYLALII